MFMSRVSVCVVYVCRVSLCNGYVCVYVFLVYVCCNVCACECFCSV